MLERHKLDLVKYIDVNVTQMYDYVKLGFCQGSPFAMEFEITLSDDDIDLIIELLTQAKKERSKGVPDE